MARDLKNVTTAADFVRNFAHWREEANTQPVKISHHGKETHVLVPVDVFDGLASPGTESCEQRPHSDLKTLSEWLQDGVIVCDESMDITYINRVAAALLRQQSDELVGKPLMVAAPQIRGSLIDTHSRRTLMMAEPNAAEIPSPFSADAWIRVQTFPIDHKVVIVFRDITEDVKNNRLADVKEALLQAMQVHGWIGYVKLSQRLTIVRADEPFRKVLGLSEDRLLGVSLVDLVVRKHKALVREKLEEVSSSDANAFFEADFLANDGSIFPMSVAAVGLRGAYGGEGAILLNTPQTIHPTSPSE